MNFLFDLYGTLIDIHTDEEQSSLWEQMCEVLGEPLHHWANVKGEYARRCAEKKREQWQEINLLEVFCEMLASRDIDITDGATLAKQFRLWSMKKLEVFPHVKEMLADLKARGAGVYLLSNAQACFTLSEIEEMGLAPFFDGVLLSSQAGWKKPAKEFFHHAFDIFSLDPKGCIYVGNDLHDDVLGATSVGVKTVYIPTEQSGVYGMALPTPTHTIQTHEELKHLLLKLANG